MRTHELVEGLFGIDLAAPVMTPVVIETQGKHALATLFASAGFTRGAEIGVWKGGFSEVLCTRVPHLQMLCVDPWESYADYAEQKGHADLIEAAHQEALTRLARYDCRVMREHSVDAASRVPNGSLDFVFIDANHDERYVRADLEAWLPKIRHGGILAGHDYRENPHKPFIQVKPAVDKFTAARGIVPWFVLAGDKSPSYFWVVQ